MNDRITQAITRAIVTAVAAAATAVGADALNIVQVGTDDPILSQVVLAIIIGAVQFVLKYVGGPTVAPSDGKLGASKAAGHKTPNALAV